MKKYGARLILFILALAILVPIITYFVSGRDASSASRQQQMSELSMPDEDPIVSEDEAMKEIFKMLPGSSYDDVLEISQSYEEGGWIYKGRIKGKKQIYEYQVDGENGNVLRWTVARK